MPLPTPNKGESRQDFMNRCISDKTTIKEYPNQKQRIAVCSVQYRNK